MHIILRLYFFSTICFYTFEANKNKKMQIVSIISSIINVNVIITCAEGMV
jgi:hypothetical protein